jgi:hypothetical protein
MEAAGGIAKQMESLKEYLEASELNRSQPGGGVLSFDMKQLAKQLVCSSGILLYSFVLCLTSFRDALQAFQFETWHIINSRVRYSLI